jgi:hypothetical protein
MATARSTDVLDAIVTATTTAWNADITPSVVADPDEVVRDYLFRYDLAKDTGRKVIFFPRTFQNNAATRGEDENIYGVSCVIVERFTDAGDPTKAWIDERVGFVERVVSDSNDYVHSALMNLPGTREAWTTVNNITIYDADRLQTQKVFWSFVPSISFTNFP